MAVMHPADIEGMDGVTEGEKVVFRFLQRCASPSREWLCWAQPNIRGQEPDFLLFSVKHGLLVVEVKDWFVQQILEADTHRVILAVNGRPESRTHPDKQARGYVNTLMDLLKEVPEFISNTVPHEGKLRIPVGRLLAFPNIRREDLSRGALSRLFPAEATLLKEDLDPLGEIHRDATGQKFRDRVRGCFPFPFDGFGPAQVRKLAGVVWPVVRIDLAERGGEGKERFRRTVCNLDEAQARLASNLGAGHQIIKGPPGSGKTLVLVNHTCLLRRYNRRVQRILLVCFNIALASYLKRLVLEKGTGVGPGGIDVCHFYELVSLLLDEPVEFDRKDSAYYEALVEMAREAVAQGQQCLEKYDAVLVDEGQDFDNNMIRTLVGLLNPGGRLLIALDEYQDLYRGGRSWKALGIQAQGRTRHLRQVYRNTGEILAFSQRFIGEDPCRTHPSPALFPEESIPHGDPPQMPAFGEEGEVERFLESDIRELTGRGEFKRSEIAVLYDDKVYEPGAFRYAGKEYPVRLRRVLEGAGIPVKWVSEDVRAKEQFDVTTDRVTLVSIHSAKGLDFELVYLAGADRIRPTEATRDQLVRLLYVAMTRARYRLVIPYQQETEFIRRMKACAAGAVPG